jgi:hypothetical protein
VQRIVLPVERAYDGARRGIQKEPPFVKGLLVGGATALAARWAQRGVKHLLPHLNPLWIDVPVTAAAAAGVYWAPGYWKAASGGVLFESGWQLASDVYDVAKHAGQHVGQHLPTPAGGGSLPSQPPHRGQLSGNAAELAAAYEAARRELAAQQRNQAAAQQAQLAAAQHAAAQQQAAMYGYGYGVPATGY